MDIMFFIGIAGMALILFAFFMGNSKKWSQDDLKYDLANLLGSVMLVAYAIPGRSWPFIVLNSVWGLVALRDVVTDVRRDTMKKRAGGLTR